MVSPLYSTKCVHACVCVRGVKSKAGEGRVGGAEGNFLEVLVTPGDGGGSLGEGRTGSSSSRGHRDVLHNFTMALDHFSDSSSEAMFSTVNPSTLCPAVRKAGLLLP